MYSGVSMKLILPYTLVPEEKISTPFFFLAGPIKGGGDWQNRCVEMFNQKLPEATLAVPRRWDAQHPLYAHHQSGIEKAFPHQTYWERHYIRRAMDLSKTNEGALIFWFEPQSKTEPRNDGSPYARDTYGEIGRWFRTCAYEETTIIFGADPHTPGLEVMRRNIKADLCLLREDEYSIYPTLEETIEAAIRFVKD